MSSSLLDPPEDQTSPAEEVPGAPASDRPSGPTPKTTAVAALGDTFGRFMHTLHRAKARALARGDHADWSNRVVLARTVLSGPRRVSELAEATGSDASTVSRQIAALVKEGLLERQADPGDGRASLVVATERGRAQMEEFRQHRTREFERLLQDWPADDVATFARLLDRFAAVLDQHDPDSVAPSAAGREEN